MVAVCRLLIYCFKIVCMFRNIIPNRNGLSFLVKVSTLLDTHTCCNAQSIVESNSLQILSVDNKAEECI